MKIAFPPQRRTALKRIAQYAIVGLFALSASLTQTSQAQTKPAFKSKIINLAYQTSGDIVKVKEEVESRALVPAI
jgi:sulfonate transport system substrate-binding protein